MKFINRKEEMEVLEKRHKEKKAHFLVIYGRRRTGKTTLIENFIKNKSAIYFLADLQAEIEQIQNFKKTIALFFKDQFLLKTEIKNWDGLFEYLTEKIKNYPKKIIIVIDEYSYLYQNNKAISSILQKYWDTYWQKYNNFYLILCGSFLGMMEKAVLYYSSPLYGRKTGQIKLKPLFFKEFTKFCPKLSKEKQIEFFAVSGGTPRYILEFNFKKNIFQNIEEYLLSPDRFLYNDPFSLLSQEFTKSNIYFSILRLIAEGSHKIGELASKLETKTTQLNPYFEKLIELDLVKRETPVTEKFPNKSKKGLYFISDNFFRFWFKYIFSNKSFLEIGQKKIAMDQIKKNWSLFVSSIFEKVCQESIQLKIAKKEIPFFSQMGRWWDKSEEIDILAFNEKTNRIAFGEVKWHNQKIGMDVLKELFRKKECVAWQNGKRQEYFILFSRKGFKKDILDFAKKKKNIFLFTLKDL